MNVNFGLLPPIELDRAEDGKRLRGKDKSLARKHAMAARALRDWQAWNDGFGQRQAAE